MPIMNGNSRDSRPAVVIYHYLNLFKIASRRVIWDEDPGFLRFVLLREEVAEGPWLAAATAASFEDLPEDLAECREYQTCCLLVTC